MSDLLASLDPTVSIHKERAYIVKHNAVKRSAKKQAESSARNELVHRLSDIKNEPTVLLEMNSGQECRFLLCCNLLFKYKQLKFLYLIRILKLTLKIKHYER